MTHQQLSQRISLCEWGLFLSLIVGAFNLMFGSGVVFVLAVVSMAMIEKYLSDLDDQLLDQETSSKVRVADDLLPPDDSVANFMAEHHQWCTDNHLDCDCDTCQAAPQVPPSILGVPAPPQVEGGSPAAFDFIINGVVQGTLHWNGSHWVSTSLSDDYIERRENIST